MDGKRLQRLRDIVDERSAEKRKENEIRELSAQESDEGPGCP